MMAAYYFVVEFSCDHAAFDEGSISEEIARILGKLAERFRSDGCSSGPIRDINGNTIGSYGLGEQE